MSDWSAFIGNLLLVDKITFTVSLTGLGKTLGDPGKTTLYIMMREQVYHNY